MEELLKDLKDHGILVNKHSTLPPGGKASEADVQHILTVTALEAFENFPLHGDVTKVWGYTKQKGRIIDLFQRTSKLKHEIHHVVEKQYLQHLFGISDLNRLNDMPSINLIVTVNHASATELADKAARLGRDLPFHKTPANHFPPGSAPGPHLHKGIMTRLGEICEQTIGLKPHHLPRPPQRITEAQKQRFIDGVANMLQNEEPYKGLNAWQATGKWMRMQPELAGYTFP